MQSLYGIATQMTQALISVGSLSCWMSLSRPCCWLSSRYLWRSRQQDIYFVVDDVFIEIDTRQDADRQIASWLDASRQVRRRTERWRPASCLLYGSLRRRHARFPALGVRNARNDSCTFSRRLRCCVLCVYMILETRHT